MKLKKILSGEYENIKTKTINVEGKTSVNKIIIKDLQGTVIPSGVYHTKYHACKVL